MAIIRQKREASLRRIGVINVDTGESQVYKSMADAGAQIANAALPELRQQAEDRGVNAAKEVNRQNLIEFDDEGNPKALTVPQGFGTIASRAYQTVVERRFNESMKEEIELKSLEFAKKYPSPTEYGQNMAAYLAAMDKAAGGRFAEYISNTGQPIMVETQSKLEIAAAKARLKQAKATANMNVYRAIEAFQKLSVLAVTPESVAELDLLEQDVKSAIEEKFALTQDFVAYSKDLQSLKNSKAATSVNLLINEAKNLSGSDRIKIEAAIGNRAFLSDIEDSSIRILISQVHNLAPSKINELSSAFGTGIDALEKIKESIDGEWLPNNEPLVDDFQAKSFKNVQAAIVAGDSVFADAPEAAEEEVRAIVLDTVSKTFRNDLRDFVGSIPTDNQKLIRSLEAALTQDSVTDSTIDNLPESIRADVRALIENLSYDERQIILTEAIANLDNDAAIAKLEFDAEQETLNAEKSANTLAADLEFSTVNSRITEAISSGNTDLASKLFAEFVSSEFVDNLSQAEQKNLAKLRGSIFPKINKADLKKAQTEDAQKFVNLIDDLRNSDNLGRASILRDKIKAKAKANVLGHSADTINSWLSQADSLHSKFVGDDEAKRALVDKQDAINLAEDFQDRADNREVLTSEDLANVKKQIKAKIKDEAAYRKLESQVETSYAVSQVSNIYRQLDELTNGNGIEPSVFENIIALEQDEIDKLPEGSTVRTIAQAILDAKKPFDAKSEVRTQINEIRRRNESLYKSYNEKSELEERKDRVLVQGNQASKEDLAAYENDIYTKLAGIKPDQPIDYESLVLRNQNGELTPIGQQIIDDLGRGIILPQLATYLNKVGSMGVTTSTNAFAIFKMGSGAARYGDQLSIWNMDGKVKIDAKPLARFGAAILMYEAGLAASPEEALPKIVSNAQESGGDILKNIESAIDKKIDAWINDTYSGADLITRNRLKEAALAFGYDVTSSNDLKDALDKWVEVTFGTDDMVIGNRISEDKVVGARTKYLTANEMSAMDNAAYELMYRSMSEEDRLRLFRSRTNLEMVQGLFAAEIAGQKLVPLFEIKLKESTAAKGIYYIHAKTDIGTTQQYDGGIPLSLDAFEFKEKENAHTYTEVYRTFYRSALQADPNGARYGNTGYVKAFGEMLGLIEPEVTYGPSQATIDAERALVFARFPERINENRAEFDRLVQVGAILPEHVDEFLEYVND